MDSKLNSAVNQPNTEVNPDEIYNFSKLVSELKTIQQSRESFGYRLLSWLNPLKSYQSYVTEHNKFNRAAIVAEKIINDKKYQAIKNDDSFKSNVDMLFKEVMPKLKIKLYNKNNKMPKAVQEFFNPTLAKLRKEKKENRALVHDKEHKWKRKMEKARLAATLDVKPVAASGGATGTLLVKDIHGKNIAVLKNENVSFTVKMKNWFKAHTIGQLSYLSNKPLAQPKSERAAYILSKELGLDVAPATGVELRNGVVTGTLQLFISKEKQDKEKRDLETPTKYQDAKTALDKLDNEDKESFSKDELTTFQKFAIFDYLIGNLDRHEENWKVALNDQNEITNITAIDNANAFPREHPKIGSRGAHNQYKWRNLNIANQEFTEETVKFVKDKLTPNKIEDLLKAINKGHMKGFMDEDMKKLFRQRAEILYKLVTTNATASELGSCSDDKTMHTAINNNTLSPTPPL